MKYIAEYRDPDAAKRYADVIARITTRPWTIMEVCGGQTHAIVRFGIDGLLPSAISIVHGPGCPVCVTPVEILDEAIEIASRPRVIFCSFGDMLRVPGSRIDLLTAKARGGDVRAVYSPLDAVRIAEQNPSRSIVFLAVGFETTAPANAMAVLEARRRDLANFSMLVSHVLVPPAMELILASPDNRIQGFLAAGHVCAITGSDEYRPIAHRYKTPIVVTGFEPLDILQGIAMCILQLEEGRAEVEVQYSRCVRDEGNRVAQTLVERVFRVVPRAWRGLGEIAASGLALREEFAAFDAERVFALAAHTAAGESGCEGGRVLRGLIRPTECGAFASRCTPDHPLGAPMVSSEGACAAYYRYRREEVAGPRGARTREA